MLLIAQVQSNKQVVTGLILCWNSVLIQSHYHSLRPHSIPQAYFPFCRSPQSYNLPQASMGVRSDMAVKNDRPTWNDTQNNHFYRTITSASPVSCFVVNEMAWACVRDTVLCRGHLQVTAMRTDANVVNSYVWLKSITSECFDADLQNI